MLLSKHFGIKKRKDDDWFDAILNADTELFVDPFLVFKETSSSWTDAHNAIVSHFNNAFLLVAEGNLDPLSLAYNKALALLVFKEPRELCLGYTSKGTSGAGSGLGYAKDIAAAIADAINRGLEHPRHFEELGVLNKGIGADRISDITCTVLKSRLVRYTQDIARRHSIPMSHHRVYGAHFDERRLRWETPEVEVPTNPFSNGPLLFVPQRFLRDLPVLNADEWWVHYENEQLREDVNYEILGHVDKTKIVEVARRHPESVRRWTELKEGDAASAYDFERDPKGVWQWDLVTEAFASKHPLTLRPSQSPAQFYQVIEKVIARFRLFVEEQRGWELLWNDRGHTEKPESAAQLLFRGLAHSYCQANDISLDPEVNLGRGPVDFKFSNGYRNRAHLEVKKLHNGKFWNGLERQLPSYMRSDDLKDGWFLAVRYRDNKTSDKRARTLPQRVAKVSREKNVSLRYGLVDGRPRESASRL